MKHQNPDPLPKFVLRPPLWIIYLGRISFFIVLLCNVGYFAMIGLLWVTHSVSQDLLIHLMPLSLPLLAGALFLQRLHSLTTSHHLILQPEGLTWRYGNMQTTSTWDNVDSLGKGQFGHRQAFGIRLKEPVTLHYSSSRKKNILRSLGVLPLKQFALPSVLSDVLKHYRPELDVSMLGKSTTSQTEIKPVEPNQTL
ncbi:MAG: hypothetical protein ACO1RX_22295 [Candidatus Sericytochromatia bacterium]